MSCVKFFQGHIGRKLVQTKPIRVIKRIISRPIWTRTSEDIDHFSKRPAPTIKNPINFFSNFQNPSYLRVLYYSVSREIYFTPRFSHFMNSHGVIGDFLPFTSQKNCLAPKNHARMIFLQTTKAKKT